MFLSVDYGPLTHLKALTSVAEYMSKDISVLNELLLDEKICAVVTSVQMKGDGIFIGFKSDNLENLYSFEKKCEDGMLSKALTGYSWVNNLGVEAGFGPGNNVSLHIEMDREAFKIGQMFFGHEIPMDIG